MLIVGNLQGFLLAEDKTAVAGPLIRDVRLSPTGDIQMSVVDGSGRASSQKRVTLQFNGASIASLSTAADGHFRVRNLRAGLHVISVEGEAFPFRFWEHHAAPPGALDAPAIVLDQRRVRGQYGPPMGPMVGPGLVAAGVTATALAIVLVGKNSGSSGSSSAVPASP